MSVITDLADAVVESLNTAAPGFSQPFTAERHYQPVFELPDMQTLRVSVVPKSARITTASRHGSYFDCTVDVGVQKKLDTEVQAEIDALMNLVEEIGDHLRFNRPAVMPNAAWLSIEHEPIFAPEHLDQHRQFTSVLTVTYRVRR